MSQKGKAESGAELLARLGPRPSLHGLQASNVLGFEPSPGDVVELYGREGVGKTELLLHLVTSALLPSCTCPCCQGNSTEVVWVDCDLKFSVLRLAVLLEQKLMEKLSGPRREASHWVSDQNAHSVSGEPCDSVDQTGTQGGERSKSAVKVERCATVGSSNLKKYGSGDEKTCRTETKENGTEGKKEREQGQGFASSSTHSSSLLSEPVRTAETDSHGQSSSVPERNSATTCSVFSDKSKAASLTLKRKAPDMESDCLVSHQRGRDVCDGGVKSREFGAKQSEMDHKADEASTEVLAEPQTDESCADGTEVSGEEVERRVEECLGRVHVVRCVSSQQLVCTLHSLLSLIAANRNIAVVVIDPISAFFWSDKCSDHQHSSSLLHRNTSQVVSVLKNIATSYGVLVAVSKQALMKPRVKDNAAGSGGVSPVKGSAGEDSHVEFLGQGWGAMVTRRLVCSRSVCRQRGVRTTHYTVTGSTGQRQFTIQESGVQVLSR